jgi:hypothetical protein
MCCAGFRSSVAARRAEVAHGVLLLPDFVNLTYNVATLLPNRSCILPVV